MDVIDITARIITFMNALIYDGEYKLWDSRMFNFSNNPNIPAEGSLKITDPLLEFNLTSYRNVIVDSIDISGDYDICVNEIIVPDWSFSCDYDADMVIKDEIPFYGKGQYKALLSDITMTVCYTVPADFDQLLDINLDVQFRHGPASLDGLLNNPDLGPIVSDILTRTRYILAMWNTYEPKCLKECLFNPVLLYMTNLLIYNINKVEEIDWRNCSYYETEE
ncbi:uncharacterized protein LOC143202473 isoform X2 [Rhynchophorus ferrugineus]|uniref:uncharacterized protein LOC143202473 isoform X2 n=1 Tax=Rhynchophorus ferrugineus TaxID=354439 RepID=UPI003FCD18A7